MNSKQLVEDYINNSVLRSFEEQKRVNCRTYPEYLYGQEFQGMVDRAVKINQEILKEESERYDIVQLQKRCKKYISEIDKEINLTTDGNIISLLNGNKDHLQDRISDYQASFDISGKHIISRKETLEPIIDQLSRLVDHMLKWKYIDFSDLEKELSFVENYNES